MTCPDLSAKKRRNEHEQASISDLTSLFVPGLRKSNDLKSIFKVPAPSSVLKIFMFIIATKIALINTDP